MKKLTEHEKDVLTHYGAMWLKWRNKMFEATERNNEEENERAFSHCTQARMAVKALSELLQVDCSLTDFRFVVSTKEDGELFSWGI